MTIKIINVPFFGNPEQNAGGEALTSSKTQRDQSQLLRIQRSSLIRQQQTTQMKDERRN